MADLLLIRARDSGNGAALRWEFVDEAMAGTTILLDSSPTNRISDGDVWRVDLVTTERKNRRPFATVRLIAKVRELKTWEKVAELPGFWMPPNDLRRALIWLHEGTDLVLLGEKGTGKTSFCFNLCETLGWQEPCKVDVTTVQRTLDLFGSDAARDGSTRFVRSELLDYIERAQRALHEGLETQFLILLDEINRVHQKSNQGLHGLYDDTRQLTFTTTEGSRMVKLPPNLHTIGTMNVGPGYGGTFPLDDAMKDRFQPLRVHPMPEDYEVAKLVGDIGITEANALKIVRVARALRAARAAGHVSYAPSYRGCRNVARLVKHDFKIRDALMAFLGWYDGVLELDERGEPKDPQAEVAKAYSALRMRGMARPEDLVAEALPRRVIS